MSNLDDAIKEVHDKAIHARVIVLHRDIVASHDRCSSSCQYLRDAGRGGLWCRLFNRYLGDEESSYFGPPRCSECLTAELDSHA